jgi:ATP-dependent DNA helicase RecG
MGNCHIKSKLLHLKLPLIQSFLKEINSKLLEDSRSIPFADLCRQMALIDGGNEYIKPRNIGLLFFCDQPDRFFPYAQIDVVYFPEGEGGDIIQEEIFRGPLDHQLRSALRHIQNNFISERVIKHPDRAEADRFYNYPYAAIEEALVNAVYHRSYEIREPIEVRITAECIRIVSHPGPDPSIRMEDIKGGHMLSRRYRNRRIGELLKELDFTEGRGTGIPKMDRVLKANGSNPPVFYTDESRMYFCTEIQIHPEFLKDHIPLEAQVEAQVRLNLTEMKILQICLENPMGNKDILAAMGYKSLTGNIKKALKRLKDLGAIAYTIPEKPRSQNQRYIITKQGKLLLERAYPS